MARVILVVGAQRSASTSMAAWLGRHPDIFAAPAEVPDFDFCYRPASAAATMERLHAQRRRAGKQVLLVKRPQLLHSEIAGRRARHHIPDPVVVISLRSPLRRAVSAAFYYQRMGLIERGPLPRVLERSLRDHRAGRTTREAEIVAFSCYAAGVERWSRWADPIVRTDEEIHSSPDVLQHDVAERLDSFPAHDLGTFPRTNPAPRHPARIRICGLAGKARTVTCGEDVWIRNGLGWRLATSPLMGLDRALSRLVTEPPVDDLPRRLVEDLIEVFRDDLERLPPAVQRRLGSEWLAAAAPPAPGA